MRQSSKKFIIFSMEAKRFIQNRKQILYTFLVPVITVFALLYGLSLLERDMATGNIELYGADAYREMIDEKFNEYGYSFCADDFIMENYLLRKEKNIIVINVLQDEIQVIYDSSMTTNADLFDTARRMADSIFSLQIDENICADYWKAVDAVNSVDIGSSSDYLKNFFLPLFSMIMMIVIMLANLNVSSLTSEMILGERERGSLDLLILSGTGKKNIIFEKYMFAMVVEFLLLLVQGVALFLGVRYLQPELYNIAISQDIKNSLWFVPILGGFVAIAMVTPALFIAIAASFEKKKQAAAYSGIVQIVMAMFTYVPNILGEEVLNYLPVCNLSGIMLAAVTGKTTVAYIGGCLGISLVLTALLLNYATIALERNMKR